MIICSPYSSSKISKQSLLLKRMPSLFQNMFLVATVALFILSMHAYEGRILHGEKQNHQFSGSLEAQAEVPPISVPNPPNTTGNIRPLTNYHINNVSSLLRRLHWTPHVLVPPSMPNPRTNNPASKTSHNTAPLQKSPPPPIA